MTFNFRLNKQEILLAVVFAVMGFLLSSKKFVLFLGGKTPFIGLLIYYAIMFASLFILSKLGLTVLNVKIEKFLQTIGLLLITFAFFVVINFESQYVQIITENTEIK